MTLKERITEDMKTAMRSGEKDRLSVIRLLQAAIKQREVDERITLDDAQITAVLEKMIKQRKESVAAFEKGGRLSLTCPISVIALSRSSCLEPAGKRFHAAGPSSASMKYSRPPSMSPAAIFSADAANLAASGEGPGV